MNSVVKDIQVKIDKDGLLNALDTVLTDVAFLEQNEVNISQLAWDRDIDEDERIVVMTEDDYDRYCDVINNAYTLLRKVLLL